MSFWYLATPYTKYKYGLDAAFHAAARQASFLLEQGVMVFCPIVHTHPISYVSEHDPTDADYWLAVDYPFIYSAIGMIQCRLEGWVESHGMEWERQQFKELGKPVVPMTPFLLPDLRVSI